MDIVIIGAGFTGVQLAKRLISENKLVQFYFTERHNNISPALVLVFNDPVHPVMPIRKEKWQEYLSLINNLATDN